MRTKGWFSTSQAKLDAWEQLEHRTYLAGDGVGGDETPCLLDVAVDTAAARAVHAVNCFAIDLYNNLQRETGNVLFSPLSISTAFAMTYAGAAGETAAQMSRALHFGPEPGIHESFAALLASLTDRTLSSSAFTLELANAIWPQTGLPLQDRFVQTVRTQYDGEVQSVDYGDPEQAKQTINDWVKQKTHDRIPDLIKQLSPGTLMSLTNAIYFKSAWANLFDPNKTTNDAFTLNDGSAVTVPTMHMVEDLAVMRGDSFQALEMPLQGGRASVVFVLTGGRFGGGNDLAPSQVAEIDQWLASPRDTFPKVLALPKFSISVATDLENLLPTMGMPSAFGPGADFSEMSDYDFFINQVRHKAFFEVTEEGAEAAAATFISFASCFASGTPILTSDGEKPIEQIQVGDYVLARDEHDPIGRVEAKRVEEIYRQEGEVIELHVGRQPIRVTKRHPIYVKGRGWTPAGELCEGDLLAAATDEWIPVTRIEGATSTEPVFNFRVADYHTYFVGSKRWGFGVWVHNCSGGQCFFLNRTFHFLIRDNTTSTILFMGRVSDPTQIENELNPTTAELPGDSNGDGQFNSADLVLAFQAGLYEQGTRATWQMGDWNDDGYFDSTDLVYAFQVSRYDQANAITAVPQPTSSFAASVSRDATVTSLDADDVDSFMSVTRWTRHLTVSDALRPLYGFWFT